MSSSHGMATGMCCEHVMNHCVPALMSSHGMATGMCNEHVMLYFIEIISSSFVIGCPLMEQKSRRVTIGYLVTVGFCFETQPRAPQSTGEFYLEMITMSFENKLYFF